MRQEYISLLADKVRNTTIEDAKVSSKDTALLGPPSVEFAPYGRIPNSRPRKDARQGTIDQDPEFIDFLESLTNPVSKPPPVDQENDGAGKSKEKVTVTPLVQYLKDKKANKGKENAASAKGNKQARQDSKDPKATATPDSKSAATPAQVASPKKRSAQAVKVEQAARDAVKVLNKQAASKAPPPPSQPPSAPAAKSPNVVPNATANAALADKKRERGNASAAAKILLRDLNLSGNAQGRGGRRGQTANAGRAVAANASSPAAAKATDVPKKDEPVQNQSPLTTVIASNPTTSASNANTTNTMQTNIAAKPPPSQPPTGPAASRAAPNVLNQNVPNPIPKPTPPPSTATQAFLKHANPSQGITEPLLEEAFAVFGNIKKVEIDKKKGFAYVDFAEAGDLQKAIKASPIKVAQGQVVVLERKTGPNLQARNMRGGPMMGNRGGGMPIGRGGPIRGRGGYGRGGAGVHNGRPAPAAVNAAPQVPAMTQAPVTTTSDDGAPKAPPNASPPAA